MKKNQLKIKSIIVEIIKNRSSNKQLKTQKKIKNIYINLQ